ncbi:MAG: hypothetical protein AMJ46_03010 [Latescibacteria bacterium DG_63]|nr:MAG: hypothetical protein AMJ46_03010 [Latescibacteria bacterium DG_63]
MSLLTKEPTKVKLVAALMAQSEELIGEALFALEPDFGAPDLSSPTFWFTHSDYYRDEMGKRLVKRFCSFDELVDPGDIMNLKLKAIACEKEFLAQDTLGRTVNIDPGYLDRMKLVLSTTKNASHRIYIGNGIYGNVELIYRSGAFTCLEWTYPDYRESLALGFFREVREKYLGQLRSEGPV